MRRSYVIYLLIALTIGATAFAAGEKPTVPGGHVEVPSAEISPARQVLIDNLIEAKQFGDLELARNITSELDTPSDEEIPTGVSSTSVISVDRSAPFRERPDEFGDDIYLATASYIEKSPQIVRNEAGELYCVYQVENDPSHSNPYIKVKKSTNNGVSWFSLITVQNPSKNLVRPRIAIGEGDQDWVFIAYEARNTSGDDPSVEVAKFAFDGSGGTIVTIDDASFTDKYSPGIACDGFSFYYIYVSYIRKNLLGTNLYIAKSTDFGVNWTTQNVDGSGAVESDISFGCGTKIYAVTQTHADNGDIRFTMSSDFGSSWSTPVVVSTTHKDYFPRVAADPDSTVIVTYGYKYSSTDNDVNYSTSYDKGSSFNTGSVLAMSSFNETYPSICADQSTFYVAFYKSGKTMFSKWNSTYSFFSYPEQVSDFASAEEIAPDIEVLRTDDDEPCPGVVWTKRLSSADSDIMLDKDCCPEPDASFTADIFSGDAPLEIHFTNESEGADSYDWDFGDGTPHSTVANPIHTFYAGGDFTVTLTAENECGTDTYTRSVNVICPEVVASFDAGPETSGEIPLEVDFISTSTGSPISHSWDFGDGSSSTGNTTSHTYTTVGDFTVSHISYNACGNSDTATGIIHVYASSDPEASYSPASIDLGSVDIGDYNTDSVEISNSGTGVLWIFPGAPGDDAFSITEPDSFAVYPGESYWVEIYFSPSVAGTYNSTLVFVTNDADNPNLVVNLAGTGTDPGTSVDSVYVSPEEWDFDSIRVHDYSNRRIYIHNNTADTVWIDSLRITGDDAFSFPAFVPEPVPPGAYRYHEAEFCPEDTGLQTAQMFVYTEVSQHTIPLQGIGFTSTACMDFSGWHLCADILTDHRAEGNITLLDEDWDTVLTLEEVAGIAFIDLDSWGGTGLCKFHKDDGSSITMMAGGFSLSSSSGQITSHPSVADINVLPDSLLKLPYDLDVSVPPITISIPDHWWKIRGVLKLKDSTTTIAEIGMARTQFGNGDVDWFLSDFGISLFAGYFELFFEDVDVSSDLDTIKAGRIKAKISRHLVPKVSAWLEHDSVAYDSLHTGRGDWFNLDAKSLAIVDGRLMSLDVKFAIPDMSFAAGVSPLTIRGVKGELKISDGRLRKIGGEGKFGYAGLMPDWAGSGAYIRVAFGFNERGWDRIGLGYHGFDPGIPLGTTGFFLTGVDGEIRHITAGIESLYVEFGCDLKGGPSLPMVGGIMEMTPEVSLDFGDDIYRLDGDVRFLRRIVRGHGLLEYRARYVGGGWSILGEATVTAGISSAVKLEGQVDAHVWTTRGGQFHFLGHGGIEAKLQHNAIFWLCPSKSISVGAHAYFGEFRLPSDMGGHWGVKGLLDFQPFGIRPQVAYIDGRFHVMDASERYQPRMSRHLARPSTMATVIEEYDITDTDINVFVARTQLSDSPEFTILTPAGMTITPDSCSTTDSTAARFYYEQESIDGYTYMGYVIHGSESGEWTITLDDLDPGDDSYGTQVSGYYNPRAAQLSGSGTELHLYNYANTDSIRVTRYIDRVIEGEFNHTGIIVDEYVHTPVDSSYIYSAIDPDEIGLAAGEYYVYCIIEDNLGGFVFAADTLEAFTAPDDITAPSAPTGCVAVVEDSIIKAAWSMNTEPDLQGYKFYKGALDSTMDITWWDTVDCGDLPRAIIEDWQWNIQDTVGISFAVTAYDNSGNESDMTQFALTGGFEGDYDHVAPSVTFGAPAVDMDSRIIDLGWLCTDADVEFYRLSAGLYDGDEMMVYTLPADSSTFQLAGLEPGITYHIRIVAVDELLNLSDPDDITVDFFDSEDSDLDGLPDWWEIFYFGDIEQYTGADDPDGDLLINLHEYTIGTAPNSGDTDDDRISDYHEYADTLLDPLSAADEDGNRIADDWEEFYFGYILIDPMETDADDDNLADFNEYVYRTNPLLIDTDGGGAPDGDEIQNLTDPTDPRDDNVQTFEIVLNRGWNMISIPGDPLEESIGVVFAGFDVYHYNTLTNEYIEPGVIDLGYGYFVLAMRDTTYNLQTYPTESYNMPVFAGWNQIGSIFEDASFLDPMDDPDGSVISGAYAYDAEDREYYSSYSIEPGLAYWVIAVDNAELRVESGTGARRPALDEDISDFGPPPAPPTTYVGERALPQEIEIYGATPNPFNAKCGIRFALPSQAEVEISVCDILGRRIANLLDSELDAGYHSIVWEGLNLEGEPVSSGVYLYKIEIGDREFSGKMIMVK